MSVEFLTMPGFEDPDSAVFHGFFGRKGGVSQGIYASLNCGPGSRDDAQNVIRNRVLVGAAVGCEPDKLLSLYQVHGKDCITVDQTFLNRLGPEAERPRADSFVTDIPGIALGILTADCAPVLFYGRKADGSPVVGAAHAGWGGALRGVLVACVESMLYLGATLESVQACVGPCIAQNSYEVREDFVVPFLDEDDENERFFKSGQREGHLMFDLPGYVAFKLSKAGVKRVLIKDVDTYSHEDMFFSYRRTTHREEPDYGRQISVVMIK